MNDGENERRRVAEQLYLNGEVSVAKIAAQLQISKSRLYKWANELGWPKRARSNTLRRSQRAKPARTKRHQTASNDMPSASRASGARAPDLLQRLYMAIELNLSQLEDQMMDGQPTTAADGERHSRAIGAIARSLEKINELSTERDRERSTQEQIGDDGDETEQLRLALAERILKLRRQHFESGCAADGAEPEQKANQETLK